MVKKKNKKKPLQRAIEQDFLRPQLHIPSISFLGIYPTGILGFMHKSRYSCFYCSFYNSKTNSLNIYPFKSYILDLGKWHWNMYNIIYETSRQSRFVARYWMLGAGALGRPRGMVRGRRREEGSGWGTRVYLWQIHVDIWQNQYNIVKLKKKTLYSDFSNLH